MEKENALTERENYFLTKRPFNKQNQKDAYFLRQSPKTTRQNSIDPQINIMQLQKRQEELGLPQITNDTFLSFRSNTPSLMESQKVRRNLDQDAQILHNRIRLLQLEEEKCKRKIEQTKKRCDIVMQNKQRYQESLNSRNQQKQKNMQQLHMQREKFKKMNDLNKENIIENYQKYYNQKRQQVSYQRQKIKKDEQKLREEEKFYAQILNQRAQDIRKEEEIRRRKFKTNQEQKILYSQINYITRVQEAEEERQNKEKEVLKMEMLEMEMIKKLRETQNMQKAAYINLEKTLYSSSPKNFHKAKSNNKRISKAFEV